MVSTVDMLPCILKLESVDKGQRISIKDLFNSEIEGVSDEELFDVKVSYEPRWILYFARSGNFQTNSEEMTGFQQVEEVSERAPLLPSKDNDLSSWGSSYESFSNEEEDLTMWLAENSVEGKPIMEGGSSIVHKCIFLCDVASTKIGRERDEERIGLDKFTQTRAALTRVAMRRTQTQRRRAVSLETELPRRRRRVTVTKTLEWSRRQRPDRATSHSHGDGGRELSGVRGSNKGSYRKKKNSEL
ncbi:hypothetical protein SESBI_09785 [Sesbania bispinosa]|nr:hypothetical protein SESBI_09785 [Sesbania bispinosa]